MQLVLKCYVWMCFWEIEDGRTVDVTELAKVFIVFSLGKNRRENSVYTFPILNQRF